MLTVSEEGAKMLQTCSNLISSYICLVVCPSFNSASLRLFFNSFASPTWRYTEVLPETLSPSSSTQE